MEKQNFSICDLCDAHENDQSGSLRILPAAFKDFGPEVAFYGPVYTVRAPEDNSFVRQMVNQPGEQRVLVVDGGGLVRRALLGGNLAVAAAKNGWAGIVVHGAVRDAAELRDAGIPIRALALAPMRTQKNDQGCAGESIQIDNIQINSGDWLYADEDGMIVSRKQLL